MDPLRAPTFVPGAFGNLSPLRTSVSPSPSPSSAAAAAVALLARDSPRVAGEPLSAASSSSSSAAAATAAAATTPTVATSDGDVSATSGAAAPPPPQMPVPYEASATSGWSSAGSSGSATPTPDGSGVRPELALQSYRPTWAGDYGDFPEEERLHVEILDFERWVSPTHAEKFMRTFVVEKITTIAKELWTSVETRVYGSFANDIYLPTSDIDLCIEGEVPENHLFLFADALERNRIATQVIASARVPIVKLIDNHSLCPVDISFNSAAGRENTRVIKRYLDEIPQLRPLILIIKYYLLQSQLNEPFTGGVGSYCVSVMLVYLVRCHLQLKDTMLDEIDLGWVLIEFFYFYGIELDTTRYGISIRLGGQFEKRQRGWADDAKPALFSIEDPYMADHDLGRSMFAIDDIRAAFVHAHAQLSDTQLNGAPTMLNKLLMQWPEIDHFRRGCERRYGRRALDAERQRNSARSTRGYVNTERSITEIRSGGGVVHVMSKSAGSPKWQ